MRNRTKAREHALQMLYQLDIRHARPEDVLAEFWQDQEPLAEVKTFADQLFKGTADHLDSIDAFISQHADNWNLKRMAVIDRNILRLGVYELLHVAEVPPKVCINEAIELAKRFGDAESGKFVNGILDAIHKTSGRTIAPSADAPEPSA
jgi:N utilization substance protein B